MATASPVAEGVSLPGTAALSNRPPVAGNLPGAQWWRDPTLFVTKVWPGLVERARELGVSIV